MNPFEIGAWLGFCGLVVVVVLLGHPAVQRVLRPVLAIALKVGAASGLLLAAGLAGYVALNRSAESLAQARLLASRWWALLLWLAVLLEVARRLLALAQRSGAPEP